MIVTIDRDTCVSCGSCWDTCPALFEEDPDDSRSRIRELFQIGKNKAEGKPDGTVEGCVQEAADLCPVAVISVRE